MYNYKNIIYLALVKSNKNNLPLPSKFTPIEIYQRVFRNEGIEYLYGLMKWLVNEGLNNGYGRICANYLWILALSIPSHGEKVSNIEERSSAYGIATSKRNPYNSCMRCNGLDTECKKYKPYIELDSRLRRNLEVFLAPYRNSRLNSAKE